MTQLNLSGRQSNNTQQKPAAEHADESIKNQTVGALGALAMFAAVIVIGSCSRSSKPVAVQHPMQPTPQASVPAPAVPVPPPPPTPVVAKTRKHRAATLSYVNKEYGLSFNFPRNYQLKTKLETPVEAEVGNKTDSGTQVVSRTTEPLQMNFVHSGGVALAAVEMPGNSYPGTDFKSAVVNVSVHPGMTAEACAQFALPEPTTADASTRVKIEPVKFGAIEFHEVENSGTMTKQGNAKYYHAFNNGACYEFALGVAADVEGKGNVEKITPVDRDVVFAKLERILATVKFQPADAPETRATVPAVAATAPADSSNTAQHEVAAPNF
jgi:hypothetical protein